MKPGDENFVGIPWKAGGRNFAGADCVGLTCLWLAQNFEFTAPAPSSEQSPADLESLLAGFKFDEKRLQRGDVIFFRHGEGRHKGEIRHVAVWLGGGKLLHTFKGCPSRIENGFALARRVKLKPMGTVPATEAETLAVALAEKGLMDGGVSFATYVIVGVLFTGASIAASLLLSPKVPRQGNKNGKYSFNGLATQNSPEVPLPDILGAVTVAGNSPFTQLSDKALSVSDASQQAVDKIVVLCSGPIYDVDTMNRNLLINGVSYSSSGFYAGSFVSGVYLDPAQSKSEAVDGTIAGDTHVPSMSVYSGQYDISVPVDIRASYDRTFPIYGYPGCAYLVFRLINSAKFPSFNLNARVKGKLCRTYDSDGFITATSSAEAVGTGDGTTVRFKLLYADVASISSVTVGGTAYTQIAPGNQTGNIYNLNRKKGFIEFMTAPSAAAAIVATYDYYVRDWSQCPADHIIYLLTETVTGKGLDEARIDWPRAVEFQTYCNDTVTWTDENGTTTGPRYTSNYSVDSRKPIQEHLQAILDASLAYLFVSQGKFVLKARKAETSVFSFNETNILKDSFSAELVDRSDRPNSIPIFFHDQTTFNSETEVPAEDATDQSDRAARVGNDGVVPEQLKYPAIDNASQAQRIGQMLIRESINSLWTVSLKTTILGLAIEPGDVVDVTHSSQPGWSAKLFRVENIGIGDDDRIDLGLSEYFDGAYI